MSDQPNILFITSDQQHWRALGCQNPEIQTPHLDRLASEGTLFERAYCPNPTCTPTRASLITGLYPSQHGAYSLGTKLDEKQHVIGDDFQAAGYDVSLIGKAHFQQLQTTPEFPSLESYPLMQDLDFWRDFHGPFYGFNHIELARNHADEGHVGQHYALWMEEKGLKNWRDYFVPPGGNRSERQTGTWDLPQEFHYNTWIVERSIARMEMCRQAGRPFFLWSSFPDPHPPYLVPKPWHSMYNPAELTVPELHPGEHDRNPWHFRETQKDHPDFSRWKEEPGGNALHGCSDQRRSREVRARNLATYYGMMSFTDHAVGAILSWLDQQGLRENTLIVFTTDHGHFLGQHGLIAKGPFHYEDLVKVPMIVSRPGKIPKGRRSEAMQSLVDIPVTLLSETGVPSPHGLSGLDQSAVWRGEKEQVRDHVVVENRHQPTVMNMRTYIDERYKLTLYRGETEGELFDLQEDPDELRNLWDEPEARELKSRLLLRFLQAEMEREPRFMPRVSNA